MRIPLDVLGLSEARAWTVDDLEGMSISALLAVGFHVNEGDPALAMMERLSDDLLTLALALSNPNEDIPNDRILSILDGLSIRARVAAELHRRELAAAEST